MRIFRFVFTGTWLLVQGLLFSTADGQQRQKELTLKTGDTMPDLVFHHMYNYTSDTLRLSDLKGTPVIFDFWSTSCSSCLESFAKMDSLQKWNKGKVQIIMVNNELRNNADFGPQELHQLFKKRSALHKPDLPYITKDSTLKKLLAPMGLPCLVWMDGKRVIRKITHQADQENVERFISGRAITLKPYGKREYIPGLFDPQYREYAMYHSYIARIIPGVGIGGSEATISLSAVSIPDLFHYAWGEPDKDGRSKYNYSGIGRSAFEIKDSIRYFKPAVDFRKVDQWYLHNTYIYSLNLPKSREQLKYEYMRQDLERYFGLTAAIEKRKVPCLVLRQKGNQDRLATRGGELLLATFNKPDIRTDDKVGVKEAIFRNVPFSTFSGRLGHFVEHNLKKPFIDATQYAGNIDFKIKTADILHPNLPGLNKELGKYGLVLKEELWEMDVLVVREQ